MHFSPWLIPVATLLVWSPSLSLARPLPDLSSVDPHVPDLDVDALRDRVGAFAADRRTQDAIAVGSTAFAAWKLSQMKHLREGIEQGKQIGYEQGMRDGVNAGTWKAWSEILHSHVTQCLGGRSISDVPEEERDEFMKLVNQCVAEGVAEADRQLDPILLRDGTLARPDRTNEANQPQAPEPAPNGEPDVEPREMTTEAPGFFHNVGTGLRDHAGEIAAPVLGAVGLGAAAVRGLDTGSGQLQPD